MTKSSFYPVFPLIKNLLNSKLALKDTKHMKACGDYLHLLVWSQIQQYGFTFEVFTYLNDLIEAKFSAHRSLHLISPNLNFL